jgi:hypothetical protein
MPFRSTLKILFSRGKGGGTVSTSSATPAVDLITDTDSWTGAYEIVQRREPELMTDYKKHLASAHGGAPVADLSTPRSVESIVNKFQTIESRSSGESHFWTAISRYGNKPRAWSSSSFGPTQSSGLP